MIILPLNTWLLSSFKNDSPFLSWMTKGHWEVVSSSLKELTSSSSSSSSSLSLSSIASSSPEASREGDGEATKPPRWSYHYAIRPTWGFTWYNLVVRVSRWASMRWSCAMIALRVTPPVEEEWLEVEGMVGAGGSIILVCGHFDRSWASLRQTDITLMAPMTV